MAYSTSNPPALVDQRIAGGPAEFVYSSTDTVALAAASSYFSDGSALGLRVGDIMHVNQLSTAGALSGFATCRVNSVTSGAGATITCASTTT